MATKDEFWDEVHQVLCPSLKHFGRNWDAFIDILREAFGSFEYGENIIIKIKDLLLLL